MLPRSSLCPLVSSCFASPRDVSSIIDAATPSSLFLDVAGSDLSSSSWSLFQGAASSLVDAAATSGGIGSVAEVFLHPETALAPVNGASETWIRGLVWSDFRVAVAFFVVAPLILLSWAVLERFPNDNNKEDTRSPIAETVLRLMTSYWQASSLLLLTVALNILESNAGVFAGFFAQAMIVVSLWWWEDLNQEIATATSQQQQQEGLLLGRIFSAWRGIATVSALAGVLIQAPFQGRCLGAPSLAGDPFCAPWLEPPQFVAFDLLGLETQQDASLLGVVAAYGCALYASILAYYAIILLPSVGRSGRAARPSLMDSATPIGAWKVLGFLEPQDSPPEP